MGFHDFLAVAVLLLGTLGLTLLVIWLIDRVIRRDTAMYYPHDGLADLRERLLERED